MVLAKPRSGITLFFQDFADGGAVLTDNGIVAWEAGGHLADLAKTDRVMVATGDERRPRRRTKRGGMELRIAQSGFRDAVHGWCRDDAAECARHAIALVVGHDEQNVRRALWRYHSRRPPRFGIYGAFLNHAAKRWRWRRKLFPADCCRCAG